MKLQEKYKKEIMPKMKEKFGYKNTFQTPKVNKIVINVGFGRQSKEKVFVDSIAGSLTRITGQKPIMVKAKKSISAFKLKEGTVIGAMSTLRGKRMYDFLDKLINATFPRVRDFRGITTKIMDKQGNATIGFKEHLAFPEIGAEEMEHVFGLEVCIATTARNKEEGLELLKLMGVPFKKDE